MHLEEVPIIHEVCKMFEVVGTSAYTTAQIVLIHNGIRDISLAMLIMKLRRDFLVQEAGGGIENSEEFEKRMRKSVDESLRLILRPNL